MQAEPTSKAGIAAAVGPTAAQLLPVRLLAFLAAVLLLFFSTLIAFTQSPRPNPFTPVDLLSSDFWRYPLERNALQRLPVVDSNLNDLFLLPGTQLLWAVGSGGMILHSRDGGRSWLEQPIQQQPATGANFSPPSFELISAAIAAEAPPVSKQQYVAPVQQQQLAPPGNLRIVQPGRQQSNVVEKIPPIQQTIAPPVVEPELPAAIDPSLTNLNAVHFVDADHGWIVGDSGLILQTSDGGRRWQQQLSNSRVNLRSVQFADRENGWAVGDKGVLLQSRNAGENWQEQRGIPDQSFAALFFLDASTGWTVGENGLILHTGNGGDNWREQPSGTAMWLAAIDFVDRQNGWAVGGGVIQYTANGGQSWTPLSGFPPIKFTALDFIDQHYGWVVASRGEILLTSDGGRTWQVQDGVANPLAAVQFADAENGWAVGSGGTILQTTNGGRAWQPQSRGGIAALFPEQLAAAEREGNAPGPQATVSAKSRAEALAYKRYPAPWYYLSWLFAGIMLIPAVRKPTQIVAPQQSVADVLVSDKPLEAGEPDALNFGLIARGLSRYLRNANTQPPLTIAITGEWGTGKSSLMNLLKADLQEKGVRPVWFNAWHHQKETNLLASLLDNIRNQAVPHWWSFDGLQFRLNLLLVRGWRNCLPVLFVLFVFAVSAGVVWNHSGELKAINWKNLPDLSFSFSGLIDSILERFPFLTLSASSLALFIAGSKGFIAFGLDPKKLIPTIPGRLQIKTLDVELSFRQKFSREFKDVTKALQPRTMLILIDDLDRCKAEHVLEILETVNYLVSSGACYVVLGMARERVERCIGAAFKEVADDMIDDPTGETTVPHNGRLKRIEFARQYLEKLINIEVPVPVATAGQSRLLLAPELPVRVLPPLWRQCLGLLLTTGNKLCPWLLLLLVLWGGFWLGKNYQLEKQQESAATLSAAVATDQAAARGEGGALPQPSAPGQRGTFTPGQSAAYPKWLVSYPLLLLLAAGVVLLVRRPDYQVQDSPEFVRALQVWHPLIASKRNTPRAIKRFLNRVRYFAMINRDQPEAEGWRWLQLLKKSRLAPGKSHALSLAEATLVALGALHHLHPRLVQDDQLFAQFAAGADISPQSLSSIGVSAAFSAAIRQVFQEHEKVFGRWSCTEEERAIFLEISQGIQVI